MREMVLAFWNALLPQFEPCAFEQGSMKMGNLNCHGFLEPILKAFSNAAFELT